MKQGRIVTARTIALAWIGLSVWAGLATHNVFVGGLVYLVGLAVAIYVGRRWGF